MGDHPPDRLNGMAERRSVVLEEDALDDWFHGIGKSVEDFKRCRI